MKKVLLASAVATLSVGAAQAAPELYGRAFLTVDYLSGGNVDTVTKVTNYQANLSPTTTQDTKTDKVSNSTTLTSRGSRIGLRGGEALNSDINLDYQLEYGVRIDDNSTQFVPRDTYLGLTSKQYGSLRAGRLLSIDADVDYVGQSVGQYNNSFGGATDAGRVDSALRYVSPNYSGVQVLAMHGIENNQWGLAAKYEPQGQAYRAGASYIKTGSLKTTRLSGDYRVSPMISVGALYQLANNGVRDAKNENVFSVSGVYKTGTPWTAYAQADLIKNVSFADGSDSQQLVVGGKYAFNPATTGHIYAGIRNNEVQVIKDNRVNNVGTTEATTTKSNGFGVGGGIEYRF